MDKNTYYITAFVEIKGYDEFYTSMVVKDTKEVTEETISAWAKQFNNKYTPLGRTVILDWKIIN